MLRRARDIATLIAGGDPSATPPVHPLRWPGSWNRKTEPPVMATIIEENATTIDLAEALAALEDAAQASGIGMPRKPRISPPTIAGRLAQIAEWLQLLYHGEARRKAASGTTGTTSRWRSSG